MFKSTSDNMQGNARRSVTESRSNTKIDETAFRTDEDLDKARGELVQKNKDYEKRLADLKHHIGNFLIRGKQRGSHADKCQFERWNSERNTLVAKKTDLERQLSVLKVTQMARMRERENDLPVRFLKMAKLMLASPVFERVLIAALHSEDVE